MAFRAIRTHARSKKCFARSREWEEPKIHALILFIIASSAYALKNTRAYKILQCFHFTILCWYCSLGLSLLSTFKLAINAMQIAQGMCDSLLHLFVSIESCCQPDMMYSRCIDDLCLSLNQQSMHTISNQLCVTLALVES